MADEYYKIPDEPQFSLDDIRKVQNNDPVNAETVVNPLIMWILENIAAVHKNSTNVAISATPPAKGPALWFCSDREWRPEQDAVVATAILGDPAEAESAAVTGEVNDVVYPVINATVSEEGGQIVATIEES